MLHKLVIHKTRGRFLITGKSCPLQMGHKDLEHRLRKSLRYFVVVNGSEQCTIPVAPGSHGYVYCFVEEAATVCKIIKMKEMKLPKKCVLLGHWNEQHAGGGRKASHGLGYRLYLIPEDVDLKDAAAFTYRDSMQRDVQHEPEALLGDTGQLHNADRKEGAHNNVSRNTIPIERTEHRDENSALHMARLFDR